MKHLLAILFICLVVSLHYWNINPTSYPWWHRFNNDIDAAHATTTVGLLNNSEFTFVYHPAATISTIHGTFYRLLAAVDPSHQKLLHLDQVDHYEDALDLIALATKTSRYIIWLTYLGFVIVVYGVLWQLTRIVLSSFLFTFYITCCPLVMMHSTIIRPEILTLIFALGGTYTFLSCCTRKVSSWQHSLIYYSAIGLLMGFAVFSKIQIIPLVLVLFLLMTGYLYVKHLQPDKPLTRKRWIVFLVLANALLFPWWTFVRPKFLTEEFLKHINPHSDMILVYGSAPKTLVILPFMAFFILLIIAAGLWPQTRRFNNTLAVLFVWLNGLLLGFSLSIYAVLLPVSATLRQYLENTHHMVYATMTNIVFMGYLSQPATQKQGFSVFSLAAGQQIFARLKEGNIFNISLGYILIGAVILCGWQILKNPERRKVYSLILICFLTAFVMDLLSLKRDPYYKPIYFIYTITIYGTGLALAVHHMKSRTAKNAIAVVLVLHVLATLPSWKINRQDVPISQQNPMIEWTFLEAYTEPFWNIVNETLRKHL